MKLTWIGHSCFALESNGYRIILDPYNEGSVPGLKPVREQANQFFCSHEHGDHNAVSAVTLQKGQESPFTVTELETFHDGERGAQRGRNTIRIFDDGTYKVAHMGDLGCRPEEDQMQQLKGMDVILIPVGGFYTIDGEQAASLILQLMPRIVVPMHFRGETFGFDVIRPVDDFLNLQDNVTMAGCSVLELPGQYENGTVVLEPLNKE